MKGKSSAYGCLDLQEPVWLQIKQKPCKSQLPPAFGLAENESRESIVIEDDVSNNAEQCKLEHNEAGKGEDGSPWQRMKWTGKSVKLLVTILSYIGEDPSTDCAGIQIKMSSLLRKQGKWKCVSKFMAGRGYHVSPQQCEDKFNNLNKTYRRLNDLLGKGTSCKVVENPKLLDIIDVSERTKEDVRKLLTSKHLFFEEMCSYHNGNRLYLPHDPDLLRSFLIILKNEDDSKLLDSSQPVLDGTDQKAEALAEVDIAKDNGTTSVLPEFSVKWLDLINENDITGFANTSKPFDSNQSLNAQGDTAGYNRENYDFSAVSAMWLKQTNENEVPDHGKYSEVSDFNQISDSPHRNLTRHEDNEADGSQESMARRANQLEKQKLQLKSKVLNLEKKQLKWKRLSWKQELKLDKMRLRNKCLKHGNECIAMQLKEKVDLESV
ncbi:putative Sequence-specific DNA binding transcription factor [Hibiscus syriacus]|uniref:Sequence-specific DNA binding transcription factor n=1 Tax=Hibiscus syriacus TaxID=106335 RepID=A0A6A2ZKW7_HIBSY|nr:uncharacterized protein LOC120142793 [Hibiscus syriacus]KAE8692621.1 putative Sequence-specific DNA binding transcription factor [Hibiscus syriacus]